MENLIKPIINLQSRMNNKLIQIDNTMKYKLDTEFGYRIGFNNNSEECTFIDPAGGPFIRVGTNIDGLIVKAIYPEGIIEFEQ